MAVSAALVGTGREVAAEPVSSLAGPTPAPTQVVLKLKWRHQFQFAGYYAAEARGFYRAAGLEVRIVEGAPSRSTIASVLAGEADFGISDAELLLARMAGRGVVVCAAIFQHSPYVLLTRRDRGLTTPQHLAGRRVMLAGEQSEAQLLAMFAREGLSLEQITVVPHSWSLDDLIDGRVDAVSAYATEQPYRMRQRGVEAATISARDYGIDFYGDMLFVAEALARQRPELVTAFVRASLEGWRYAMAHPEEIAALILTLDGVRARGVTTTDLLEEARAMRTLVLPDLVEVGHVNPGRLDRMAQTLAEVGLFHGQYSLSGFVFDPSPAIDAHWRRRLMWAAGLTGLALTLALVWVGQLRRTVRARTADLEHEVAHRRETERQLRASEERLRLAVEYMPVMLCAFDEARRTVFWNAACERVTGYTAEEVFSVRDLATLVLPDPAQRERWLSAWQARGPDFDGWEFEILAKDGSRRTLLWSQLTSRIHVPGWAYWGIGVDVTEIRRAREEQSRLERQLQQGQKLESLGVLAGGIAHDFNNLLTSVLGYADLALGELEADAAARADVEQVVTSARRAAELTRQLLAYSGRGQFVVEPIDVSTLVRDIAQLLALSIPKHCWLVFDLASDAVVVEGDATQLRQVVMNLIINAAEAIGDESGTITISSGAAEVGTASSARHGLHDDLPDGRYGFVRVADTGHGMTDEVKQRIFDPFFTTKFTGRGLGLAAALGIVRGHHGALRGESEPGRGSAFTLLLPALAAPARRADDPATLDEAWRGHGLAMVVDDEASVRALACRMLQRLGFDTCTAADGREALELIDERAGEVSLVLLDMTMPVMDGETTYAELRRRHPRLPVIMSSGYSEQDVLGRHPLRGLAGFVQKPYHFRELRTVVAESVRPDADAAATGPAATGTSKSARRS